MGELKYINEKRDFIPQKGRHLQLIHAFAKRASRVLQSNVITYMVVWFVKSIVVVFGLCWQTLQQCAMGNIEIKDALLRYKGQRAKNNLGNTAYDY